MTTIQLKLFKLSYRNLEEIVDDISYITAENIFSVPHDENLKAIEYLGVLKLNPTDESLKEIQRLVSEVGTLRLKCEIQREEIRSIYRRFGREG